jgi:hypothetical protein
MKPMARKLAPVVASAGKTIGEEGLATTARVLNNVVQGNELKDAITSEGKEGIRNLLGRAERKLSTQRGSGGGGKSRKRARKQDSGLLFKPSNLVGKSVLKKSVVPSKKKTRFDSFGQY